MASIFRRGPIWWIKYHLLGQRVQHSLNTTLQRVAEAKRREVEYRMSTGGMALPSDTPLAPFLEEFCQRLRALRTFKSYKNDLSCLRTFFGPACPSLQPGRPGQSALSPSSPPPERAAPAVVKTTKDPLAKRHIIAQRLEQVTSECIAQYISLRIQQDGIAPKTANRLREVLHRMFVYAIKERGYRGSDGSARNPVAQVDRRREPAPVIRYLTLPQVQEQLRILEDHPSLRTMVAVYIYAGLRREEALWLTAEDVDLQRRLLRVRAKTVDGQFWQPKTRCNRVVPISQALWEILSAFAPAKNSVWYFRSPQGKHWNPDNFSRDLRQRNAAHGLPWGCLDYRHTFGSQLAQKGESLYKIATLMGNSPEICRRHYAALVPEVMHDVVEFAAAATATAAPPPSGPGPALWPPVAAAPLKPAVGWEAPYMRLVR